MAGAYAAYFVYRPLSPPRSPFDFTVKNGASLKAVARQLHDEGLFAEPFGFWLLGTKSDNFVASSLGNPPLFRPFVDDATGGETVELVAVPVPPGQANSGMPALAGTVTVNGGSGLAGLNLFDQANRTDESYTLTSSTVAVASAISVTYQNLANVVLNTGKGTDVIIVQSTPGTTVSVNGAGSDTLVGSSANNLWRISGTNAGTLASANSAGLVILTSMSNLTGGPAANAFVFADAAGISGNLDGGGGGSLDYSAYSSSVIVDLQSATATGVGGTIANIQTVTGGTGGGPGIYNILVGSGGNTLIGGFRRPNIRGTGSFPVPPAEASPGRSHPASRGRRPRRSTRTPTAAQMPSSSCAPSATSSESPRPTGDSARSAHRPDTKMLP